MPPPPSPFLKNGEATAPPPIPLYLEFSTTWSLSFTRRASFSLNEALNIGHVLAAPVCSTAPSSHPNDSSICYIQQKKKQKNNAINCVHTQ